MTVAVDAPGRHRRCTGAVRGAPCQRDRLHPRGCDQRCRGTRQRIGRRHSEVGVHRPAHEAVAPLDAPPREAACLDRTLQDHAACAILLDSDDLACRRCRGPHVEPVTAGGRDLHGGPDSKVGGMGGRRKGKQ